MRKKYVFGLLSFILLLAAIKGILRYNGYVFLPWVRYVIVLLVIVFIILLTFGVKNQWLRYVFILFEVVLSMFVGAYYLHMDNKEEIVEINDKTMIKETHTVLLSNWIKYYDYENCFVRKIQERVYEAYDDSLGEFLYRIYYDENGNVIKRDGDN